MLRSREKALAFSEHLRTFSLHAITILVMPIQNTTKLKLLDIIFLYEKFVILIYIIFAQNIV